MIEYLNGLYNILLHKNIIPYLHIVILGFFSILNSRYKIHKVVLAFFNIALMLGVIRELNVHYAFMLFEISVLIACILLINSQNNIVSIGVYYLSSVCAGSMAVIMYFVSKNFLTQFVHTDSSISIYIGDAIFVFGAILCIGAPPFINWNIRGYSNLNSFSLINGWIVQVIIMLTLLHKAINNSLILQYTGIAISIYTLSAMIIEYKSKRMLFYLTVYLLGCIMQHLSDHYQILIIAWTLLTILSSFFNQKRKTFKILTIQFYITVSVILYTIANTYQYYEVNDNETLFYGVIATLTMAIVFILSRIYVAIFLNMRKKYSIPTPNMIYSNITRHVVKFFVITIKFLYIAVIEYRFSILLKVRHLASEVKTASTLHIKEDNLLHVIITSIGIMFLAVILECFTK